MYRYTKLPTPYSRASPMGLAALRLCSHPGAAEAFSMLKLPVFRMSFRGTCRCTVFL